ncbi:MAG TPA: hypothetical protein GXZ40_02705, partial [Bacteroidales bacterium]|nr:hypothetical protein [Bacteroidales bacterium]
MVAIDRREMASMPSLSCVRREAESPQGREALGTLPQKSDQRKLFLRLCDPTLPARVLA